MTPSSSNNAAGGGTDTGGTDGDEVPVTVKRDGAVAVVWLDRPQRRNAYTPAMGTMLGEALVELDRDESVRAIVVTGRGKDFSVGADFDVDWRDPEAHGAEDLRDPASAPWNLATPIIGAVRGAAIGVALTWAAQFDIRVVSDDAHLAFAFNRVGIMPDRGSLWLLPRLVGFSVALDLLLTGRRFDGAEAQRIGFASRSVPAEDVLPTALEIAQDIATACAPISVTATKQLAYAFLEEDDRVQAYNYERRVLNWVRTQGETKVGIAARRERSVPNWRTTTGTSIPEELY